jgi:hypothetical protein
MPFDNRYHHILIKFHIYLYNSGCGLTSSLHFAFVHESYEDIYKSRSWKRSLQHYDDLQKGFSNSHARAVAHVWKVYEWSTIWVLLWRLTPLAIKSPTQSRAKTDKTAWGLILRPHLDTSWCSLFFINQFDRESLTANDSSVTQTSFIRDHTDWNPPACNRPISQNSISYESFGLSIWWDWYFRPFSSQTLPNAT